MSKVFTVKLGKEKVKTIWTEGEHRVALTVCVPNDWNMNKVEPMMYAKLKVVIQETLDEAGRIPPITARPHPDDPKKLQIIDGEHRWKILQELGFEKIDVTVLYVSKRRAMGMTAELNYNRGEPDMEKYPQYLSRMMKEFDVDADWLSQRLPDSADEIKSYLEAAELDLDDIKIEDDVDDLGDEKTKTRDASDMDHLVEMKFVVRQGAAEVIERELSRLKAHLGGGKNERGRALEVMAVLSSQTPNGSISDAMVEEDDEDISVKKPNKKKKKKAKSED